MAVGERNAYRRAVDWQPASMREVGLRESCLGQYASIEIHTWSVRKVTVVHVPTRPHHSFSPDKVTPRQRHCPSIPLSPPPEKEHSHRLESAETLRIKFDLFGFYLFPYCFLCLCHCYFKYPQSLVFISLTLTHTPVVPLLPLVFGHLSLKSIFNHYKHCIHLIDF